jgi:hypothetical protein
VCEIFQRRPETSVDLSDRRAVLRKIDSDLKRVLWIGQIEIETARRL